MPDEPTISAFPVRGKCRVRDCREPGRLQVSIPGDPLGVELRLCERHADELARQVQEVCGASPATEPREECTTSLRHATPA